MKSECSPDCLLTNGYIVLVNWEGGGEAWAWHRSFQAKSHMWSISQDGVTNNLSNDSSYLKSFNVFDTSV